MPEGSDNGKGTRRDRSFADAMRESGGEAPTWTGSVINPRHGGPSPEERERMKADVRARDEAATPTRPWYLTTIMSPFVPSGCFTTAVIIAGFSVFMVVTKIISWRIFVLDSSGVAGSALNEILLARVLHLLLAVGLVVAFYFTARRYQRNYRRTMEELVRDTPDQELLEPAEADLNAAYDGMPRLVKGILLRRPTIQKEWVAFLRNNLDVYLASRDRYRIPFLEWAGRFWVFIWFFLGALLSLPESAFLYTLFDLLAIRAGLPDHNLLVPGSTVTGLVIILFIGHALALQEIRRDVVNRAINVRAPRDPAVPAQPPPPPPGPANRLADRFRRQDLGMEYQYVLAAVATIVLFPWLFLISILDGAIFSPGEYEPFRIANVLILIGSILYIIVQSIIRSRLRVRVAERLDASGLLIDLAEEGGRLGQIYDFTPRPFTWFLGPRPRDHRGWLRLLANNIDWYLQPPRTLFRAQWLASLAIPVTIGLIVALSAGFAGHMQDGWLLLLIALLLFLFQVPLQQVILRHSVMCILTRAIRRSLAGEPPDEARAPATGGD